MRKSGLAVLIASLLLAYGTTAMAGQSGHPGSAHPGGSAPEKMHTEGKENTNAQWSAGADKGQDRAEERRSAKGATHEKSHEGSHDAVTKKPKKRMHKDKKKSAGQAPAPK